MAQPIGAGDANERPAWTKQQCRIRRRCLDRLRYWQGNGYQVLWATLTSAPGSPNGPGVLRASFQELLRSMSRRFGFRPEYCCVETREGHGVLHILLAARRGGRGRRKRSFFIPQDWLSSEWLRIHGAWHVNIKRVRVSNGDRRRLSGYLVAQYCGDQSGLVRFSQSRGELSFEKARVWLRRLIRNHPSVTGLASVLLQVGGMEHGGRLYWELQQEVFRDTWSLVLEHGGATVFETVIRVVDRGLRKA